MEPSFDPDGPAGEGLFGLPCSPDTASVVVLPVPFEATASSGHGTGGAPDQVLRASWQVDLSDPDLGDPWKQGLAMETVPTWLTELAQSALENAGRARTGDPAALRAVNEASELVARHVQTWTAERLQRGQVPAVVGGDHSVPLGAFRAATSAHPGLGVLHIDAHADLREAYEGFIQSHASIFFNALKMSGLARLVQVGLRDVGTQERALAAQDARVTWWTDDNIRRLLHDGATFRSIAERVVETLPEVVWVSFDIDGLDPSLCPATGTPVPGGLDWHQAMTLLEVLGRSGRRLIGFDLCEVGAEPWDANVAARLLYKLSGWALASRQELP